MKKKSLVAMGLAGIMTIGMCVPVLAADTDTYEDFTQGTSPTPTTVEMQVSPSYTVSIPTKLNVNSSSGTVNLDLKANNTVLNNEKVLEISVSTGSIELELAEDATTKYKMNFSGTQDTGKWVLGTFETGLTEETSLSDVTLKRDDNAAITKAGTYSKSVQFSIAQVNKTIS